MKKLFASIIAVTLSLVTLAQTKTAPFHSINQPDGTFATYNVDCGNPNAGKVVAWSLVQGEPSVAPLTFTQGLPVGDRGWQDENRKSDEFGKIEQVAPLFRDGGWKPAYYRSWSAPPFGSYQRLVWPAQDGALTVLTNNSTVVAFVKGSPCESLRIIGDNNKVFVVADSGEQSRLMLTRPAVIINGDGNTVTGWARHPICALYLRGNANNVLNFTAVIGPSAVGDDTGAVYYEGKAGQKGGSVTNLTVVNEGRAYPYQHMTAGLYLDDKYSYCKITNLTVIGQFKYGLFSHGGNYNTVSGLTTVGVEFSHKFASHFTTSSTAPIGCKATNVVMK